ncbi:MAG: hypothetical protein JXQ73_11075 [Phycisphaerae bacterium]|nr:hypothetical protein [Phycisphaerae bacterium]
MRFVPKDPPRTFRVGRDQSIELSDCGRVYLAPDELLTFETPSGREHDFAAKSWGFYATPSVNGRLKDQGFKTALVRNRQGRIFVMVVEQDRMPDFEAYCRSEQQDVLEWLDER